MNRQVWILNHYVSPPGTTGGSRHYQIAKRLIEHGWEATLIGASVPHSAPMTQRLDRGESHRIETIDGVRFVWIRSSTYRSNSIDRIINMVGYSLRAAYAYKMPALPKPDAIVGSSVHILAALTGLFLSKKYSIPFIFEVRDLWPLTLIARGAIAENGITAKTMRYVEKRLYLEADRIVSVLPRGYEYITQYGVEPSKVAWIPNGVDCSAFCPSQRPKNEKITLMYLGSHGLSNDLDLLIEALDKFAKKNRTLGERVNLRLIGEGERKGELRKLCNKLGLEQVVFEDGIPQKDIPPIADLADIFVHPIRKIDKLYKYGISPNKTFDYMAAGRPTIISRVGPDCPVEKSSGGISIVRCDVNGWAEAIEEIVGTTHERRVEMGYAAREYVIENHDFGVLAKRMANVLDDVANK